MPIIALLIPVTLVVAQPDLGTAVLILIGGIAVIWLTGFRIKYFLYSFFVLICLIPVGISVLKPYQKSRILTFFDPERDPLGACYQIIQSKIAIGSGGIFGINSNTNTTKHLSIKVAPNNKAENSTITDWDRANGDLIFARPQSTATGTNETNNYLGLKLSSGNYSFNVDANYMKKTPYFHLFHQAK